MKAGEKSTAGARPASPQKIRAALERWLKASTLDEKKEAFGALVCDMGTRLPDPPPAPRRTPDPSELPIPPDQHQRAVQYVDRGYYGLDAIVELARDYDSGNAAASFLAIEYVAERCKRLLGAAGVALESFDVADDDELVEEKKRYTRRREGKPEEEEEQTPANVVQIQRGDGA